MFLLLSLLSPMDNFRDRHDMWPYLWKRRCFDPVTAHMKVFQCSMTQYSSVQPSSYLRIRSSHEHAHSSHTQSLCLRSHAAKHRFLPPVYLNVVHYEYSVCEANLYEASGPKYIDLICLTVDVFFWLFSASILL